MKGEKTYNSALQNPKHDLLLCLAGLKEHNIEQYLFGS